MIGCIQERDRVLKNYYKKEIQVLKKLGFNEFQPNLFKFYQDGQRLYIDYRFNTRRSWAVNNLNEKIDKNNLAIYQLFKQLIV